MYGIVSDSHFHNWNAFSHTGKDGVNSRLQIIIDEMRRAAYAIRAAGGNTIIHGGDTFHVRGSIDPTVLNPVKDLYKELIDDGFQIAILAGNHDLASKSAERLSSAITALEDVGCTIVNQNLVFTLDGLGGEKIVMLPWQQDLNTLRAQLKKFADPKADCIIHAPLNGVIKGIPNHGLEASELAAYGYKRVFAGHYHDAKAFCDETVFSIGALTHQTWSDIDAKAGFLLVYDDRVEHHESKAPKFVDLNQISDDETEEAVKGNYVRLTMDDVTDAEIKDARRTLTNMGAIGINVSATKRAPATARSGPPKSIHSLDASVESYVRTEVSSPFIEEISNMAQQVLAEART